MKTINSTFKQMVTEVPADVKIEVDLSFAIADLIDTLIKKKGLTKKEFADSIGKRPSEQRKEQIKESLHLLGQELMAV